MCWRSRRVADEGFFEGIGPGSRIIVRPSTQVKEFMQGYDGCIRTVPAADRDSTYWVGQLSCLMLVP